MSRAYMAGPWMGNCEGYPARVIIYKTQHTRDGAIAHVYGDTPAEAHERADLLRHAPELARQLSKLAACYHGDAGCPIEDNDRDNGCPACDAIATLERIRADESSYVMECDDPLVQNRSGGAE